MVTGVQRTSESSTHHVSVARVSPIRLGERVDERLGQRAKEHGAFNPSLDTVAISARAHQLANASELYAEKSAGQGSFGLNKSERGQQLDATSGNRSFGESAELGSDDKLNGEQGGVDLSGLQEDSAETLENPLGRNEPSSQDDEETVNPYASKHESVDDEKEADGDLFSKLRASEAEKQDFLFGLTDQPYRVEESKGWQPGVSSGDAKEKSLGFGIASSLSEVLAIGTEGGLSPSAFGSSPGDYGEEQDESVVQEAETDEVVPSNLGISASASMRVSGPPEQIYSVQESKIGSYQLGTDGNRRYFVEPEQEGPFGSKGPVAQIIDAYLRQSRGQAANTNGETAGVNTVG